MRMYTEEEQMEKGFNILHTPVAEVNVIGLVLVFIGGATVSSKVVDLVYDGIAKINDCITERKAKKAAEKKNAKQVEELKE